MLRERILSKQPFVCRLVGLDELIVHDDGVYIPNEIFKSKEDKLDILYRLHPLEILMDDESEDGYPVGLKLMELANFGAVDLVNPVNPLYCRIKHCWHWHGIYISIVFFGHRRRKSCWLRI